MTTRLSEIVRVKPRFARSANIERDDFATAVDGYVPTARAVDVVSRVVAGIEGRGAERAISVTGPYGSGKSSLALFLSALFGPAGQTQAEATDLLHACDVALAGRLQQSRAASGQQGFIVCTVVAQREPVTTTLLRAMAAGASRFAGGDAGARRSAPIRKVLEARPGLSATDVRELLFTLSTVAPVLLVIDEFGKNLEQFVATGGAEDDLFVLQEIAEWASSADVNPIVLLTLQHLAFEDYAASASTSKRREWSKVQGRFADVPYVESPAQSQALITSVYQRTVPLEPWAKEMAGAAAEAGIADQIFVELADLYPLHPVTAAVLPELCSRYGQNERTLFSFLAGPDPGAVPAFLAAHSLDQSGHLPTVDLEQVYDFFLESASTMVAASASASRWLEIETRIRDAVGLKAEELQVLKSVAVMNLVSAGGSLRASRPVIEAVCGRGKDGAKRVASALASLEAKGLVTYREFADEFRVWSGSDFDLKSAVELARRRVANEPASAVLQRVRPQAPIVAARHSQVTGTLRVFERRFVCHEVPALQDVADTFDGLVLMDVSVAGASADPVQVSRPVVVGRSPYTPDVVAAGRELAAHLDVLDGPEGRAADWVARRELSERSAAAASALDHAIENAFGAGAQDLRWEVAGKAKKGRRERILSAALSQLCDERYPSAPIVRNEMLSRRDLTSQGARARRDLLDAMVSAPIEPRCGIEGYGPERAMYEAILARPQIHRRSPEGGYVFGSPVDNPDEDSDLNFGPAWRVIEELFEQADESSVPLAVAYQRLMEPPIGLKEGPIPVLLVAALLAHAQSVAVYENGSFVTRLDAPVVERLIRNPDLFSFKSYSSAGGRGEVVRQLAQQLGLIGSNSRATRNASIVNVVGPLLGRARALPAYAQKTKRLGAAALRVRAALFNSTEPDALIFERLPEAVGLRPFKARSGTSAEDSQTYVRALGEALDELSGAFPQLLTHIEQQLQNGLAARGADLRLTIAGRVSQFADMILEPDLKSFVFALSDGVLDRDEWLEYLGMVVTSKATSAWTDEDVSRFDLRVTELTAAVRRIEGLYYERSSPPGDGFQAVRISLTTSDGIDRPQVVWVDDAARPHLESITQQALERVEELLGPGGREMLLATLALDLLGDHGRLLNHAAETPPMRKVQG